MPTPTPTPTWLLLGRVLDDGVVLEKGDVPDGGVVLITVGESFSSDDVDGMEDVSTVGVEELVVAVVVEA